MRSTGDRATEWEAMSLNDLLHRVTPDPDTDCWLWNGPLDGDGYGLWRTRVHRAVYLLEEGPVPDGLVLDHLCRVRNCCNPEHLEPVTPGENVRRGWDARLALGLLPDLPPQFHRHPPRTHCVHGHELTADNLYIYNRPNGLVQRRCVTCRRESDNRRYRQGRVA